MPKPVRSVLAILGGFFAMVLVVASLTLLCVAAMHLKSGQPTPGYLVINVAYSLGAALLGGWLTARLAGYKPLLHGAVLAGLLLLFGLFSLRHPAASQPYGYQVLLAAGMPFAVLAGSAMVRRRA